MADSGQLVMWMKDDDTVCFASLPDTGGVKEADLADVEATFMEVGTAKFIERALAYVRGDEELEHVPGLTGTPVDEEDDEDEDDLEDEDDEDDE